MNHEKVQQKHDTLCEIVSEILYTQGLEPELHLKYEMGELDVFCNGIYYEVKCNYNNKTYSKGKNQIYRAIKNCESRNVEEGYIVTYKGVYKI